MCQGNDQRKKEEAYASGENTPLKTTNCQCEKMEALVNKLFHLSA